MQVTFPRAAQAPFGHLLAQGLADSRRPPCWVPVSPEQRDKTGREPVLRGFPGPTAPPAAQSACPARCELGAAPGKDPGASLRVLSTNAPPCPLEGARDTRQYQREQLGLSISVQRRLHGAEQCCSV